MSLCYSGFWRYPFSMTISDHNPKVNSNRLQNNIFHFQLDWLNQKISNNFMRCLCILGKITYQYLMTKRRYIGYAIVCVIWSICFACESKNNNSDLAHQAINSITEIFKSHPIVALGESHGWKEESEFIFALIKNEEFERVVNDIVVECGNAKYQSLMDDYIMNGKQVPQEELQEVWRNMTVLCTCDAPIYEELFTTVRSVNKGLKGKKLRVLLGEPALDWSSIRKGEDLNPWIIQRDVHYAGVVEKEVLSKGRKALLIMGSFHLIKAGWGVDHTGATMFTGGGPQMKMIPQLN